MKAVQKFKTLVENKRPSALSGALGKGLGAIHSSLSLSVDGECEKVGVNLHQYKSFNLDDRRQPQAVLATDGARHTFPGDHSSQLNTHSVLPGDSQNDTRKSSTITVPKFTPPSLSKEDSGEKGHAHDPLDEEPLILGIGAGGHDTLDSSSQVVVAESPTAAEFNIYDKAYQEEVRRIRGAQGHTATVYLNRRVDSKRECKHDENLIGAPPKGDATSAMQGFKELPDKAREQKVEPENKDRLTEGGIRFSDIAAKAIENTKSLGRELSDRSGGLVESFLAKAVEKRNEQKEAQGLKERDEK